MTDQLYRTPMNGIVLINWSLGQDEDGEPHGYVGTPISPDDEGEALRDCIGSDIFFATKLRAIDDESMAKSIRMACLHAVGKYIMPQLVGFMYDAAIELRERDGGFSKEMHDARLAELQAEMDAEDSAD